jgi:hypothetical protein
MFTRSRQSVDSASGRPPAGDNDSDPRKAGWLRASAIARRRTEDERAEAFFPLRARTTATDSQRDARAAQKRDCERRRSRALARSQAGAPLSWTSERADMFFVCERVRKTAAHKRQPQRAERATRTERAEAFSPLFDCSLPLAADRAWEAAYFVVAHRRKSCRLAPPQHGGARSGASEDDGDGFTARCASSPKAGLRASGSRTGELDTR